MTPITTQNKSNSTTRIFNNTNQKSTMKKNLFIIAFALLSMVTNAQEEPKNAVKINPLSLLIRTGNVSYERALSNKHSVQLAGFYSGAGLGDFKYQGYGIIPEIRFYFGRRGEALNGGYIAPFGRYQNLSITNKELKNKSSFTTVGGGAVLGFQKTWTGGFALNFFAGPSFNNLNFENDNAEEDFDPKSGLKGFGLRTGLTIGIAF